MKVSGGNPKATDLAKIATTGPGTTSDTKKSKGPAADLGAKSIDGGSAKVDLSARAQEMNRAKELATPNQGVDEAKVARLQALIDGGKYKVDSSAVADRLLGEHLLMDE